MPRSAARHGTPSGYQAHRRVGESACDACYRAHAAWHTRHASSGEPQRQRWLRARAQHRALRSLKNTYPDVYRDLYRRALVALWAEESGGD